MARSWLRDNEAFERAENAWLRPPEYDDEYPTCRCGEYPEYQIGEKLLCSGCVWDFVTESLPFEDEYCEYCGDYSEDGVRVDGDYYCKECFEKAFAI